MIVNEMKKLTDYVPSALGFHMVILFGEDPINESCFLSNGNDFDPRMIDILNIKKELKFFDDLPRRMLSCSLERDFYFKTAGEIFWKIPHLATRISSQFYYEPLMVWNWNRDKHVKFLRGLGFERFVELYEGYFMCGWKIFYQKEEMKVGGDESCEVFQEFFVRANDVFREAYRIVLSLEENKDE